MFKSGQKFRALRMKTYISFVAGYINSPKTHFCATLNISILTDFAQQYQHALAFPLESWLRECATLRMSPSFLAPYLPNF
jgi:hypothetical protein